MQLAPWQEEQVQETVNRLLRRCDLLFWAGASWAESPPTWFAQASRGMFVPPELDPQDSLHQVAWEDAPSGCALVVARNPGATYRLACGVLMPQRLVLGVAIQADGEQNELPRAVLAEIALALRSLRTALPEATGSEGGAPPPSPLTPLSKWAWLPLPGRRPS